MCLESASWCKSYLSCCEALVYKHLHLRRNIESRMAFCCDHKWKSWQALGSSFGCFLAQAAINFNGYGIKHINPGNLSSRTLTASLIVALQMVSTLVSILDSSCKFDLEAYFATLSFSEVGNFSIHPKATHKLLLET